MDWPDLPFGNDGNEEAREWNLEKDIQENISPQDFEILVADTWEDIRGCSTRVTQKARDGGIDVVAKFKGLSSSGISPLNVDKIVIQVKKYSSRISTGEIERMEGVRRRNGADEAVFVTASKYTTPAEEAAEDLEIEYVEGDELIEMLNESSLDPDEWKPSREEAD